MAITWHRKSPTTSNQSLASYCTAPGSAASVPELPDQTQRPANGKTDHGADERRLDYHPDEGKEAACWSESPNAAYDEKPLPGTGGQRREDTGRDRDAGGKVVAATAIIGFRAALL